MLRLKRLGHMRGYTIKNGAALLSARLAPIALEFPEASEPQRVAATTRGGGAAPPPC